MKDPVTPEQVIEALIDVIYEAEVLQKKELIATAKKRYNKKSFPPTKLTFERFLMFLGEITTISPAEDRRKTHSKKG